MLRARRDEAYVFRVSAAPGTGGRYRLEINHADRVDQDFPGEDAELARRLPGCAPPIMNR